MNGTNLSERRLFELRESRDPDRIGQLRGLLQAGAIDLQQGQEQLRLWLQRCDGWISSPLPGNVNTEADEFCPVQVNDSLFYFTRANGAGTLCYSEDIYSAYLKGSNWYANALRRPYNTCHNESVTSISLRDSVAYIYGQFYSQFSNMDGKIALTANYPNDMAQRATVTYLYDPESDYQTAFSFLYMLPISVEHSPATHNNYVIGSRASTVIDNRGDLYKFQFIDGRIRGVPTRLNWPVSGSDWESDAVMDPEGTLLYFVSDRPNDLYPFEEKPTYYLKGRNHWGNTNIYYVDVRDTISERHFILGQKINSAFAERTPSFSVDGDTMYFSSNGLPGFGGMDVYYCVRLNKGPEPLWSLPNNLGPGVNTEEDELWFKPGGHGKYVFARRTNGNLDIYSAVRIPFLQTLTLYRNCGGSRATVFTEFYYDGHTESHRVSRDTTTFYLDEDVEKFSINMDDEAHSRTFERCPVFSDSIELAESEYSLRYCGTTESLQQGFYDWSWSFLQNETSVSINAALIELRSILSENLATKKFDSLDISIALNHNVELFNGIIELAEQYGAAVTQERVNDSISTVTVKFR